MKTIKQTFGIAACIGILAASATSVFAQGTNTLTLAALAGINGLPAFLFSLLGGARSGEASGKHVSRTREVLFGCRYGSHVTVRQGKAFPCPRLALPWRSPDVAQVGRLSAAEHICPCHDSR